MMILMHLTTGNGEKISKKDACMVCHGTGHKVKSFYVYQYAV